MYLLIIYYYLLPGPPYVNASSAQGQEMAPKCPSLHAPPHLTILWWFPAASVLKSYKALHDFAYTHLLPSAQKLRTLVFSRVFSKHCIPPLSICPLPAVLPFLFGAT